MRRLRAVTTACYLPVMTTNTTKPRMTEQEIAAHELSVAPIPVLLRTAYSLTHRLHAAEQSQDAATLATRSDLRAQRDLIDAEIIRRTQGK